MLPKYKTFFWFFGTDHINQAVMILMKKNIPIHPDCIWLEIILQLWNHFINLLVEVWKWHSLHIISLIVTHLYLSFQGNQLVITLHTIHFYQKDWNPQIHLHLICGNLKGIYSFPQVLCHCYECAMKHTKCQKSSSTLRKPSYFLRKNVTFSKKGFSPLLKATRYFN